MDFRELHAGEKSCATCACVRTVIKGETVRDADVLAPYDGGRQAGCAAKPSTTIFMREKPEPALPVSECWVAPPGDV